MSTWRRWGANLGVLGVTVMVLSIMAEIGLRATGFQFRLAPERIEFGRPDPVMIATGFEEDPDLFWVTPGYDEKLGRLAIEHPLVIFQGDSCTHLGRYDEAFAEVVAARTGRRLSWGNVGVAGWSSHQGRVQLKRDVLPLAPKVVTIYFGWNDHWIGFGIEDKEVAEVQGGVAVRGLEHLRVLQLVTKARVALRSDEAAYPNRVSRQDFAANLRAMVATARRGGIVPMLITAPSSHVEGREPEELVGRFLRTAEELVPMHRDYVETVRAVADETSARLCDVAAHFADQPREVLERWMMADGIHLTAEGDRALAEAIYDCFDRASLIEVVSVE